MNRSASRSIWQLGLTLVPLACTGAIGDVDRIGGPGSDVSTNPGETPGGENPADPGMIANGDPSAPLPPDATGDMLTDPALAAACAQAGPNVGIAPLRRLTRDEYLRATSDLLAGVVISKDGLSPDETVGPFRTNLVGKVTDLVVQQYMEAAETLATAAGAKADSLVPCNHTTVGDAGCADQFIAKFGQRAYRRPLSADETARYKAEYTTHAATGGYGNGVRVVMQTMLQSPHFLFHIEPVGGAAEISAIDPYVLASRLSFFLWGSIPDDALLAAAQTGRLGAPDTLQSEVDRMLKDAKAGKGIDSFHQQWLGVDDVGSVFKDPQIYPSFSAGLRAAMAAEPGAFANHVMNKGDGRLETLLTAPYTVSTDPLLLKHYGSANAKPGADGTVVLPGGQRAGLLTEAAFLAMHSGSNQSSPVRRGVEVIKNVMCYGLPDPPNNVNATPPDPSPTATTRERFAEHEKDPVCAGCHTMIDGLGLGFENYDGIGAYRTQENGKPVDATGQLLLGGDAVQGPFDGAVALARKLAASPAVHQCVAKQWMRFALGRMETEADICSLRAALGAFTGSDHDVRRLVAAIATSDAMRYQRNGQ